MSAPPTPRAAPATTAVSTTAAAKANPLNRLLIILPPNVVIHLTGTGTRAGVQSDSGLLRARDERADSGRPAERDCSGQREHEPRDEGSQLGHRQPAFAKEYRLER